MTQQAPAGIIQLEDGFQQIKTQGLAPFLNFIETKERAFFKAKEFINLYDLIFRMCIQRDPYNWSEAIYREYSEYLRAYLKKSVVPALRNAQRSAHDVTFLKEWATRWDNQVLIVKGFSSLFMYLDRFYTPNEEQILGLKEQGFLIFKEEVFDQFQTFARTTILTCMEKERRGEQQDRHLLNQAVSVYVKMGLEFRNSKNLPEMHVF